MEIEEVQDVARRVAKAQSFEWPGIEADDMEQEIMLHYLENRGTYERGEYGPALIEKTFRQAARAYASKETDAFMYLSDQHVYTPREVRAVFENVYFDARAKSMPQKQYHNSSGGALISILDVTEAMGKLSALDRGVIVKRYADKDEISGAEKTRLSRAIDKVCAFLNRKVAATAPHDGTGSRKVITNANAHARVAANN